jgi:carboxyl-terminal processing protease
MFPVPVRIASTVIALALAASVPAGQDAAPLARRAGPLGLRLADGADGRVEITDVQPGSPAAKAGIEGRWTLESVGGREIRTRDELRAALRGVRAGDTVELSLRRGEGPASRFAVAAEAAKAARAVHR